MVAGRIATSAKDKGAIDPALTDQPAGEGTLKAQHGGDRVTFWSEMASFEGENIKGSISAGMDGCLWFSAKRPDGREYRLYCTMQDLTDAFMAMVEEIENE